MRKQEASERSGAKKNGLSSCYDRIYVTQETLNFIITLTIELENTVLGVLARFLSPISCYHNERTQDVINWNRHGDAGIICGRSCLPSHTDVGKHCHYRWFMLHWFIVLPILRLSTAPNKAFTHQPAMTCWFSFPSHTVNCRLVGSFSTVTGTQIKPSQSTIDLQLANSCRSFTTRESLTDVVYVWPDCVVGRSLTRVVIRLGNWETQRQREKEAEERRESKRDRRGKKNTKLKRHGWVKCTLSEKNRTVGVAEKRTKKCWTRLSRRLPSDDYKHLEPAARNHFLHLLFV